MSRRVARALHSPDGTISLGDVGEGQYVKRVGSRMVGVDAPSGSGGAAWGEVTGTLSDQTDLQIALDAKASSGHNHDDEYDVVGSADAALASALAADFSGAYGDLADKPTLGNAAAKNVGTAAGTVAAGDHTHAGGGGEAFPVGSVFIAVVDTDPATLLGYGTWSAFSAGRMLVGLNAGDADFDTAEETGGAKTVTLTGAQSGMPQHTHNFLPRSGTTGSVSSIVTGTLDTSSAIGGANQPHVQNAGPLDAAQAHNNMPPYIVVYMWKRTA